MPTTCTANSDKNYKGKRDMDLSVNSYEVRSAVMERAKKVQANLPPEFPSLIKQMQPSHVSGSFCLNLTGQFCKMHLPKEDATITLEDENGMVYLTKYLPRKNGLSGGWKRFSEDHKLLDGDAVVFQLILPTKFKVHIVRARDLEEEHVALDHLRLDDSMRQMNPSTEEKEDQYLEPLTDCPEEKIPKNSLAFDTKLGPMSAQSDQADVGLDVWDGIRFSETTLDFKEVKSFEDFHIIVNGLIINSELPKHMQIKYYELCCSQKSFLHNNLIDGLNCKLVGGIIAETVNVADAIRASKLPACQENLATWERTLKAFAALGMDVSFLLERMTQLTSLATKSKKNGEVERVGRDAKLESLQAELLEVKETVDRINAEIEILKKDGKNFEFVFQEAAKAPW